MASLMQLSVNGVLYICGIVDVWRDCVYLFVFLTVINDREMI